MPLVSNVPINKAMVSSGLCIVLGHVELMSP